MMTSLRCTCSSFRFNLYYLSWRNEN